MKEEITRIEGSDGPIAVFIAGRNNGTITIRQGVVNGRFCPQSVRNFCPIVAGFNASTYKVPACVL